MKPKIAPKSVLVRVFVFTVLWVLLSQNAWNDWPLVVGVILIATASSFALWPVASWKWRVLPLMRFIPYFLKESIAGGIDVTRRALSPEMPLDPALIEFPLRLRSEAARVFFAWTVSLLPGTLSVRLDSTCMKIHVLDQQLLIEEKLHQLEDHIGALFDRKG